MDNERAKVAWIPYGVQRGSRSILLLVIGNEMSPVIIYSLISLIAIGLVFGGFAKHGWRSFQDDLGESPGAVAFLTITVTVAMALWLAGSLGWFWLTILVAIDSALDVIKVSFWYQKGGVFVRYLVATVLQAAFSLFLVVALWVHVL